MNNSHKLKSIFSNLKNRDLNELINILTELKKDVKWIEKNKFNLKHIEKTSQAYQYYEMKMNELVKDQDAEIVDALWEIHFKKANSNKDVFKTIANKYDMDKLELEKIYTRWRTFVNNTKKYYQAEIKNRGFN